MLLPVHFELSFSEPRDTDDYVVRSMALLAKSLTTNEEPDTHHSLSSSDSVIL